MLARGKPGIPALSGAAAALLVTLACARPAEGQDVRRLHSEAFLAGQLSQPRVDRARERRDETVRTAFAAAGVAFPAAHLYLRAFKLERVLELWARNPEDDTFRLVATYDLCRTSGGIGPKREEGDRQVPEGFYQITSLNPASRYHLSLRVDYPNARDRAWARGRLGGDIYIHGGCASVGCLSIGNERVEELYWIVANARAAGASALPLHIFPARLDGRNDDVLEREGAARPEVARFWNELRPAFAYFERTRTVPQIRTAGQRYTIDSPLGVPLAGAVQAGPNHGGDAPTPTPFAAPPCPGAALGC